MRFNAAKGQASSQGLRRFLKDHPDGAHREEAGKLLTEAEFKEELRVSPENLKARLKLAALYKSEGRDGEAVATVTAATDQARDAAIFVAATQGLLTLGEDHAARRLLAEGIVRFPDSAELRALARAPGERR